MVSKVGNGIQIQKCWFVGLGKRTGIPPSKAFVALILAMKVLVLLVLSVGVP